MRQPTWIDALHIIGVLIKSITPWIACAWTITQSVPYLAGKETFLGIWVKGLLENKEGYDLAVFFFAFLAVIWALIERKIRHDKVSYLSSRLIECERRIDPHRTSSGLKPTGETPEEDKIL